MKNIFLYIFLLTATSTLNQLIAQNTPDSDRLQAQRSSVVYLNGFGNSLTYALTYDTRFGDTKNAWGGSIGLGGFALSGTYFLTIPLQVNYLFGEKNHFFEIGGCVTYFMGYVRWNNLGNDKQVNSNFVGTLNFMYRLQMSQGFFLRTGWSPYFGQMNSNNIHDDYAGIHIQSKPYFGIQPGWFGIGLGYCIR